MLPFGEHKGYGMAVACELLGGALSGSGTWQYTHTFVCPDNDGGNPNHVSGTFSTGPSTNGSAGADENVDVTCETVQVSKTANTSYRASYSWTGDKKIVVRPVDLTKEEKSTYCSLLASGPYMGNYVCDDITVILNENGVYDTVYQLNAMRAAASESEFVVSGKITVSWPAGMTPVFSGDPTVTIVGVALGGVVLEHAQQLQAVEEVGRCLGVARGGGVEHQPNDQHQQ